MDEGVRLGGSDATMVQYTLTQLRLGSKLPSLRNPLPHGRGKMDYSGFPLRHWRIVLETFSDIVSHANRPSNPDAKLQPDPRIRRGFGQADGSIHADPDRAAQIGTEAHVEALAVADAGGGGLFIGIRGGQGALLAEQEMAAGGC